jgi:hypothetical protein
MQASRWSMVPALIIAGSTLMSGRVLGVSASGAQTIDPSGIALVGPDSIQFKADDEDQ